MSTSTAIAANVGKVGPVRRLRAWLRERFFRSLRHVVDIEDTRAIIARLLDRHNLMEPPKELSAIRDQQAPYPELARAEGAAASTRGQMTPIFITGRFRSGSTLLWNLFRHISGTTSYYEPFNERRWFDRSARGTKVDSTHLGVSDYWSEYDGMQELGRYFREAWKFERLYMPAHAWDPQMQRYIQILIERARGRAVLQFNEVDFRLSWLRAKFPQARVLHIFRHPRDQWCSVLGQAAAHAVRCRVADFKPLDGFYVLSWGRDLSHYFPVLTLAEEAPAYQLFYQLWKLSYLFGCYHADYSLRFEDLVQTPLKSISTMLSEVGVQDYDLEVLVRLVNPVPIGKWKQHAEDGWFADIEARVDREFEEYSTACVPERPRLAGW